jgi:3-methylcrotonyl-CoA carboxylase alpha subunit
MNINLDGHAVELAPHGDGYRVAVDHTILEVQLLQADDQMLDLLIDGRHVTAHVSSDGIRRWVTVGGRTWAFKRSSAARRPGGAGPGHATELASPMPGQVRRVLVKDGEAVKKSQTLLILEAMKMEIRIQAPFDGTVKSVLVAPEQTVDREQMLVVMEPG